MKQFRHQRSSRRGSLRLGDHRDPANGRSAEDRLALERMLDWAEREARGQGSHDAADCLAEARRRLATED